jgi:hypothetical protein
MKFKRLFRIIAFAYLIVSVLSLGAFATDSEAQSRPNISVAYFNQRTVLDYGQSFISEIVSHVKETSWTANTRPSEIVRTYDLDNNVNAYIINLETDNKPTGYLLIEAFTADSPNIMEFGYSGVYYITDDNCFAELKSKRLIYIGNRGFITDADGEYRDAHDNQKINMSKESIKSYYFNHITLENEYLAKAQNDTNNY